MADCEELIAAARTRATTDSPTHALLRDMADALETVLAERITIDPTATEEWVNVLLGRTPPTNAREIRRLPSGMVQYKPARATESNVDRVLRLRRAYDAGDLLAAVWVGTENELTPAEFDEYMEKYRAGTVTVSPEFKQRVEASSLGTFAARRIRQSVSDDVAATVLAHSQQVRITGADRA